jgi:AbrB family looped-hinge helix DNA binding protein
MAKVNSKFQVTVPKAIADQYGIRPGDEIGWTPAGAVIHLIPPGRSIDAADRDLRLRLFDQATERHRRCPAPKAKRPRERGWRREDIYRRGRLH